MSSTGAPLEHDDTYHQISRDLHVYQAAAMSHLSKFSTLISAKATRFRRPRGQSETPRPGQLPSPHSSDSVHNKTPDDEVDDDSDCSQNLAGFEGLYEPTTSTPRAASDDDAAVDDGEDSSSNGVYASYRAERIQQILNGSGNFQSSDGEHADSMMSEDDKPPAPPGSRHRSSSRRSAGSTEATPATSQPSLSLGGGGQGSGAASSSIIPWDLIEPFRQMEQFLRSLPSIAASSSSPAVPSAHFQPLSRQQILYVLRVTKGNAERGQKLCVRYSALLDRLGLHHVTREDLTPFFDRKCMCSLDNVFAKDGSSMFFLRVRRLPPEVASSAEYATGVVRAILYLLEQARGSSIGASGPSGEGGDIATKTSSSRSSAAEKASRDRYTFLVDVSKVETSVIHALGPALAQGRELLHSAYPLRVARVVLFTGTSSSSEGKGVRSAGQGPTEASVEQANLGGKQKKSSVLTFLTKKDDTRGFAGKMWLSVTVSAFKLKYLPSTIRSRVVIADKLDAYCSAAAVNAYLADQGFEQL